MNSFKNLTVDASIESDKDSLGGSKYTPLDSGVYDTVIDLAYVDESKGGAMSVNFVFKTQEGKELRQNIYVTSGAEKGKLNYYVDKEGNKKYLPGFNTVNDICLLANGTALNEVETETKVLSIYNFDQKKEVPTKKEVLVDLIGKEVTLGILKVIEDKYNKPGETRTINDISKVFRTDDKLTVNEVKSEETESAFYAAWSEKNTGLVVNKAGKSGSPAGAKVADAPKKSLFGK
jgi:hypothetical protein